ncbi:MAG: cytochrome P450, partial [Novosphingobium sp.]|nr:cytochrome P450 [Novosphingobium sp.]
MATLTEAVEKPAHVPDEAVFDFDYHHDPALLADPHARMIELLEIAPKVFWTPRNRGTWIAIGFDEVFSALRRTDEFSSSILPPEQIEE